MRFYRESADWRARPGIKVRLEICEEIEEKILESRRVHMEWIRFDPTSGKRDSCPGQGLSGARDTKLPRSRPKSSSQGLHELQQPPTGRILLVIRASIGLQRRAGDEGDERKQSFSFTLLRFRVTKRLDSHQCCSPRRIDPISRDDKLLKVSSPHVYSNLIM